MCLFQNPPSAGGCACTAVIEWRGTRHRPVLRVVRMPGPSARLTPRLGANKHGSTPSFLGWREIKSRAQNMKIEVKTKSYDFSSDVTSLESAKKCDALIRSRANHGTKAMSQWEGIPPQQAEKPLRGVQQLPSRQVEKQLRRVQPVPPRQAEIRLCCV